VAEILGVALRWVYELLYSGRLAGSKRGTIWRIRPDHRG
jgi:excisionase family DNA binding protein